MHKKNNTRKNKSQQRRQRKTQSRRRGGDVAAAPVAGTDKYILVECVPDSNAKKIFALNPGELEKNLKGKYLFKLINIAKVDENDDVPLKEKGFFSKRLVLGDVSNIKFKGQLVPSTHLIPKTEDVKFNIPPVEIVFKFSKDLTKINLVSPAIGKLEKLEYKLSGYWKQLNYISRNADMFQGKIRTNFLQVFPNKQKEDEKKPEKDD